MELVSKFYIDS